MPIKGTSITSYRPMIQGTHGVVTSGHHRASLVGLNILQQGGNAVDAGVATGLALNVVHASECGFLGVAPIIMYVADQKKVITLDGLGVWPKAVSLEYFQRHHSGQVPPGILRALTPGACDAWFSALEKYGTMTFAEVAQPAIELAEQGVPFYPFLVWKIKRSPNGYQAWPGLADIFLPHGRPPEVGESYIQRNLGATLSRIVEVERTHRAQGRERALRAARDYIYKGELAKKIVSFCQEQGGLLTLEDLAEYQVDEASPVKVNYRGYDVYACGPWCQGPILPIALKTLEGFDLRSMGHNSAAYIHTVIEALNLAFADREQYIGDPRFVDVPMDELVSEEYHRERRKLIDPDRAWPEMPPPGDPRNVKATLDGRPRSPAEALAGAATHGGSTTFFGVIDRDGNIFSSIPTEAHTSGAFMKDIGLAVCLRGSQSKLEPGHPAALAPGKRPRLTPAPALALKDGEPYMAFGGFGGDHIPQGMLQEFLNVVEFGLNPQEAVEEPRAYTYNFPSSQMPDGRRSAPAGGGSYPAGLMRAEERIPEEVLDELRQKGHKVERLPDWWEGASVYGVITRDPATGELRGGADPRGEAFAIGY